MVGTLRTEAGNVTYMGCSANSPRIDAQITREDKERRRKILCEKYFTYEEVIQARVKAGDVEINADELTSAHRGTRDALKDLCWNVWRGSFAYNSRNWEAWEPMCGGYVHHAAYC